MHPPVCSHTTPRLQPSSNWHHVPFMFHAMSIRHKGLSVSIVHITIFNIFKFPTVLPSLPMTESKEKKSRKPASTVEQLSSILSSPSRYKFVVRSFVLSVSRSNTKVVLLYYTVLCLIPTCDGTFFRRKREARKTVTE